MLFEKIYKELLKYYTESINDVPRSLLGMKTSIIDLPEKEPYGFWVDRSGNFLEVDYQDHIGGLERIAKTAQQFLAKQGVKYTPTFRYSDLFDLGWMRVVLEYSTIHYELGIRQVPTPSQVKFLKILQETYDKESVEDSR